MSVQEAKELLVVMAKEPVPGQVKTRLYPQLSHREISDLYRSLLQDKLIEMGTIKGIEKAIAYTPEYAKKAFTYLVLKNFGLFAQYGNDLGERLSNIFKEKLTEGYEAISIIDSDTPDLPKSIVIESFRLLLSDSADVVFGPCDDGGYYLVGMKKLYPELFTGIPWSTENVLSISLEKAEKMGIKVALLAQRNDIDTFQDLLAFFNKYRNRPRGEGWPGEKTFSFLLGLGKDCFRLD